MNKSKRFIIHETGNNTTFMPHAKVPRHIICALGYKLLTIQKRVSLAKLLYWSMVDRTLNIRHTKTTMNLRTNKNISIMNFKVSRRVLSRGIARLVRPTYDRNAVSNSSSAFPTRDKHSPRKSKREIKQINRGKATQASRYDSSKYKHRYANIGWIWYSLAG